MTLKQDTGNKSVFDPQIDKYNYMTNISVVCTKLDIYLSILQKEFKQYKLFNIYIYMYICEKYFYISTFKLQKKNKLEISSISFF